jgi:Zn-dependent protease with chaperone function
MAFVFLIVVAVASLPGKWPHPPAWLGADGSALAAWFGAALWVAVAALSSWASQRQLARAPLERSATLRRYAKYRRLHLVGLLTFYLVALYPLGWADTVRQLVVFGMRDFPGVELVILAPFLVALILSWALFYNVERAIHDSAIFNGRPMPGRWPFVAVQARHNLILVCPLLLLMIAQQVLLRVLPPADTDWLFPILSLVLMVGFFLVLPLVLRLFLGLTPLPPGPLRDRLLAAARRLNVRCNDILLWNTRNGIANAMVTGVLPGLRYIVVTDRLVRDLTPEEVEAVFGHEVGHVKHRHLLFYLVFLLASMVVVVGVWEALASYWELGGLREALADWWPGVMSFLETEGFEEMLPLLAVFGGYIFLVFGFLSRHCERQADIYGCRAVSCTRPSCTGHHPEAELAPRGKGLCPTGIHVFIGALEKVCHLNGIDRDRPGWLSSWLHSTTANRVEFLREMGVNPAVESRFQRRVGLVKWGLIAGLVAVFAALVWAMGPARVADIFWGSFGSPPPAQVQGVKGSNAS